MNSEERQQHEAEKLTEAINRSPPHADKSFPLLPLSSKTFGNNDKPLKEFIDEVARTLIKANRGKAFNQNRQALKHVVFSLIHCIFRWEVLALPTNGEAYVKGSYLHGLVERRPVERIITALAGVTDEEQDSPDNGWMFRRRKGYLDATDNTNKAAVYFPTKQFIRKFFYALYTDFGGWDELNNAKLYRFNKVAGPDRPALSEYHDKIVTLRDYNTFMREQSWAMKNPSSRVVSHFYPRGGRIYNYYQNIANRRYKVRSTTLLNGGFISEEDFSSNHLWMFSYLVGETLPADAYSAIVQRSGCSRDQVKAIVTKLLGSTHKAQRGILIKKAYEDKRIPCTKDEFKAIEDALYQEYLWLKTHDAFYCDRGAWLQGLEGEIALRMLKWATVEEIPMLAVHDAFAVNVQNGEITNQMMHHYREEVLKQAVADRYLDIASSKQAVVVERIKKENEIKKAKKAKKTTEPA